MVKENGQQRNVSRRDFLRLAWGSAAGQAGDALARGVRDLQDLLPGAEAPAFAGLVRVGAAAELAVLPVGTVVGTFAMTERFYLSRVPEGWLALHTRCTQQGCSVVWCPEEGGADALKDAGCFACPGHRSAYDRYGDPVEGPAPYPLDLLLIERHGGAIYVRVDTVEPRVAVQRETDPTSL